MNMPLELHLGLVRLNAELGNLQRAVQKVLNSDESPSSDASLDDSVAKLQYRVLEAAIRTPEEQAIQAPRIALKQDDRSMLLRIAYPPGQRVSRSDLLRILDATSSSPDSPAPTGSTQTAARY